MKKNKMRLFHVALLFLFPGMAWLGSCNKALPVAVPTAEPVLNPGTTQTIGDKLSTDPDYSVFAAILEKVGMMDPLNNPNSVFTVIAPKNDAFIPLFDQFAPGLTPDPALIALTPEQFLPLLQAVAAYSIIPGQQFLSTEKTLSAPGVPNLQLPTKLKIADLPGLPIPFEMSIFPSVANGFWINNIPVTDPDQKFVNGAIQSPLAIVAPPALLLGDTMANDPDLAYFRAAVARADSGQDLTTTSSFNFLLHYPVLNMTVLAPTNAAFQGLLVPAITAGLMSLLGQDQATALGNAQAMAASPDVFSDPHLFPVLTAETVRGIIAYHILSIQTSSGFQPLIRMFQNNFPTDATPYTTLVNSSLSVHPGVLAKPVYTGQSISELTFTGLGTFPPGGDYFSGTPAKAIADDNGLFGANAVNGIYYKIDRVLLPQ